MKIVIIGCGKVGRNIASELVSEKHNIVIVDNNAQELSNVATSLDVLGICGNGASVNVLYEAGVNTADLVLAVTDSDELNMLCCVFAKKIGNCQTIARVRNPIYYEEVDLIKDELGLAMVINPEMITAEEIVSLVKFPAAVSIEKFAKGKVEMISFAIKDGCPLIDKKIKDCKELSSDVLVVGIERDDTAIIPNGQSVIKKGDVIWIMASSESAHQFLKQVNVISNKVRSAMIVGGGEIGYYAAKLLTKQHVNTTVIEKDQNRCKELAETLEKSTIIFGDGTNKEVLDEEGIKEADAFISSTNIDEENVLLSLYAKKNSQAKVITKINHIDYGTVIDSLDIGSVLYPKDLTADKIVQFVRATTNARGNNVDTLYKVINDKAEALSFTIKESSRIIGVPFSNLRLKENLLIGSIVRNRKVITPNGSDTIEVGDVVMIVTTQSGLTDILDIIEE